MDLDGLEIPFRTFGTRLDLDYQVTQFETLGAGSKPIISTNR